MGQMSVEKSVEVDAPAQAIWEQIIDVASWPSWKPFIKSSKIKGYDHLGNGGKFSMSIMAAGPAAVPITATVCDFDAPNLLAWEGGVPGIFRAKHSFEFKEAGGKTIVTTKEVFNGILVGLVGLMVTQDDFEKLHDDWLAAIKDKMETAEESEEEEAEPDHH